MQLYEALIYDYPSFYQYKFDNKADLLERFKNVPEISDEEFSYRKQALKMHRHLCMIYYFKLILKH